MNWLWTTDAMIEAMGGRPVGDLPDGVNGLSIDTRTLEPGEAFFAIKGEKFDGHSFITGAMAAGAGLIVVAESKLPALGRLNVGIIVVDDVLKALERLAIAARARSRGQIIAITGSAGKTTTKEMLRAALSPSGLVHASVKSFNNHWGVPLSLARLPETASYGIFEIGMSNPGEITPLVAMVRPHVAIITMIAAAHFGQFKNLDGIARAKAEIFSGLAPGGYVLLNRDDGKYKLLTRLAEEAGVEHILTFGEHARSDYRLADIALDGEGTDYKARVGAEMVKGRIGAPGRHLVQNGLAVLGAVHLTGADIGRAAKALASLSPERGRGQALLLQLGNGETFRLIDESYNANPASMRAALSVLASTEPGTGGRRIAVLGDMLEMGRHSAKQHQDLAAPVMESKADLVLLGGAEMEVLKSVLPEDLAVRHYASNGELEKVLVDEVRSGDVVMLKSSNGIGFGTIVEKIVKTFPAATNKQTGGV